MQYHFSPRSKLVFIVGVQQDAATPPPWLLCNDDMVRNCRHIDYGCDGRGGVTTAMMLGKHIDQRK